jgi:hypothetical protein
MKCSRPGCSLTMSSFKGLKMLLLCNEDRNKYVNQFCAFYRSYNVTTLTQFINAAPGVQAIRFRVLTGTQRSDSKRYLAQAYVLMCFQSTVCVTDRPSSSSMIGAFRQSGEVWRVALFSSANCRSAYRLLLGVIIKIC